MLVEYTIKFNKDGFSISQHWNSDVESPPVKRSARSEQADAETLAKANFDTEEQKRLPHTFEANPKAGSGPLPDPSDRKGRGPFVSTEGTPATIIGPIIFVCPPVDPDC